MEQEYRLTGTLPELQNLLQKEFKMSPQSAKLAACLLILEQRPEDETEENQSALWFLREHDQYATAILQTLFHFTDRGSEKYNRIADFPVCRDFAR